MRDLLKETQQEVLKRIDELLRGCRMEDNDTTKKLWQWREELLAKMPEENRVPFFSRMR